MKIQSKRLTLKEVIFSDLENIHQLLSLPETDQYNTLGIPKSSYETEDFLKAWINSKTESPRKKYVFCIENNANEFIGLVGINIGKPNYRNAEIWYKLHLNYWNQGYATEAVKTILHFCFTELKLHRVEGGCATNNLASRKVLEKSGMIREGQKRKVLPIRGEWFDSYEYAILEEDFISKQQ